MWVVDVFYELFGYSAVAAIEDADGRGWRIVVSPKSHMKYHVGEGERIYIVPGLWVKEPVPWGRIPNVIEEAKKYARDHK